MRVSKAGNCFGYSFCTWHAHFAEKVHPLLDALIHYEGLFIACVTKLNDIGLKPFLFFCKYTSRIRFHPLYRSAPPRTAPTGDVHPDWGNRYPIPV